MKIKKILLIIFASVNIAYSRVDVVICTDFGAADPDDLIAIIALLGMKKNNDPLIKGLHFTYILEHFSPVKKAKAFRAITGFHNVYSGIGIPEDTPKNVALKMMPMFPFDKFGMHVSEQYKNTVSKRWFPKHLIAYEEIYGIKELNKMTPKGNGVDEITRLAKIHTPENPLHIIALSPLLTLA